MQLETAKALIDTIANTMGMAIDCQNKLRALETALAKRDKALFEDYLKALDAVRRNPQTVLLLEGFARLQEKLVQN
jgi:predicted nucleic-acid-binding protein